MIEENLQRNPLWDGLEVHRSPSPCTLVIFGASGDLAHRKLVPAVLGLFRKHKLPSSFHVVGVSRTQKTSEEFRDELHRSLQGRVSGPSDKVWNDFSRSVEYLTGDYGDPGAYEALSRRLREVDAEKGTLGNRVFYLATPPGVFEPIVTHLGGAGLQEEREGYSRVVIEKPFGRDLSSAKKLNRVVRQVFREEQIYRIDHYLGKETVQNLFVMRFGNSIFEPILNRQFVDHIQITAAEDQGIGQRAGYYERAGVIRDMFQNHLFQVMCLVAMEPPLSLESEAIRDEKVKVLRSVEPFTGDTVRRRAVRGQYGPGLLAGESVGGYRDEPNVADGSRTPTFAAVKFFLETWRWQGVPFLLRSGKRLPKRATEVAIRFIDPPHLLFRHLPIRLSPNVLVIRIQPDEGVSLQLEAKVPGTGMEIRAVKLDFSYGSSFVEDAPDAYERLLLDCMMGEPTLFIRGDETEAAWSALMPLLEYWEGNDPDEPFPNYESGTWGPEAADSILGRPWRKWRRL